MLPSVYNYDKGRTNPTHSNNAPIKTLPTHFVRAPVRAISPVAAACRRHRVTAQIQWRHWRPPVGARGCGAACALAPRPMLSIRGHRRRWDMRSHPCSSPGAAACRSHRVAFKPRRAARARAGRRPPMGRSLRASAAKPTHGFVEGPPASTIEPALRPCHVAHGRVAPEATAPLASAGRRRPAIPIPRPIGPGNSRRLLLGYFFALAGSSGSSIKPCWARITISTRRL